MRHESIDPTAFSVVSRSPGRNCIWTARERRSAAVVE